MVSLSNKKILLFIPRGRGIYGKGIIRELESRGAAVTVYDERPSESTVLKVTLRLAKGLIKSYLYYYFRRIVTENKFIEFDYVLIVRGEGINPEIMTMMRNEFINARFILYLWDSLAANNTLNVFPFFDRILSFDKSDVDNHSELIFRPLFFLPEYSQKAETSERPIDVLFIGTVHNDRVSIIKYIEDKCKGLRFKTFFYFYFPSRLLFLKKWITDPAFRNTRMGDFNYKLLSSEQVSNYMALSKSSLDVEGPGQNGLTMRTIEVLGAKRKLITTNKTIKNYDFYDERNILIIDRKKPDIDPSFILSPYIDIYSKIYEKYSLKGWIDDIFELE